MGESHDLGPYSAHSQNAAGSDSRRKAVIEDMRYPKKINWAIFLMFVVLMFVLLFYFDRAVADDADSKAKEVAEKTIQAMGGMDNWMKVGAIRFNFVVESAGAPAHAAKHLWDHKNGRDHVEGSTKDGKTMVAWINLKDKTGAAWTDGKKLEGDELKQAMDWAFGRWVNDTYWLMMPMKMLDSGVTRKYEGEKEGHDVLHLSFGKVGLTPGDQYWAYINKTTGLMDKWEYHLEGGDKGSWNWTEWNSYGNIKLSKVKTATDKKVTIKFDPLEVQDSADASYFGQTEKKL
jgi:hypothetical protein